MIYDIFLVKKNIILFIRLGRVQKERDDLREQLKIVTDETLTAEEKAQQMDMLLKEEEARIYDVEKQLARLRETQVKFMHCWASRISIMVIMIQGQI